MAMLNQFVVSLSFKLVVLTKAFFPTKLGYQIIEISQPVYRIPTYLSYVSYDVICTRLF